MKQNRKQNTKLKANTKGAALTEYGILVSLISVLAIASVGNLGDRVTKTFQDITSTTQSIDQTSIDQTEALPETSIDQTEALPETSIDQTEAMNFTASWTPIPFIHSQEIFDLLVPYYASEYTTHELLDMLNVHTTTAWNYIPGGASHDWLVSDQLDMAQMYGLALMLQNHGVPQNMVDAVNAHHQNRTNP